MTSEHEPHDPFARLRDADPAADRLAAPSIAPLLERLEERDVAPVRRGARRRPQLGIVLVATVLVLAAALAAIGLVGRGPGGLDVVARARAALATNGEILHVATRYSRSVRRSGGPSDRQAGGELRRTTTIRTERWSTEAPTRFRSTRQVVAGPDGPGPVYEDDYAGRTFRARSSDSRELRVTVVPQRLAPVMAAQRLALGNAISFWTIGADPVAGIRKMLDDGRVRTDGEVVLHGRRLRRLVYRPRPADRQRGERLRESVDGTFAGASFPVEYLVDATTFAPVRIRYSVGQAGGTSAGRRASTVTMTMSFDAYERLPRTTESERLLRIDAAGLDVVRDSRRIPPVAESSVPRPEPVAGRRP